MEKDKKQVYDNIYNDYIKLTENIKYTKQSKNKFLLDTLESMLETELP